MCQRDSKGSNQGSVCLDKAASWMGAIDHERKNRFHASVMTVLSQIAHNRGSRRLSNLAESVAFAFVHLSI